MAAAVDISLIQIFYAIIACADPILDFNNHLYYP